MGNQQPQVGQTMTAELKDEDGETVRRSWQWSKGPSMDGPWEDVDSQTVTYTAEEADIDSYLRATVSYTDVEYDAADTVSGVTKFAVRGRPSANTAPTIPEQSIEIFESAEGTIGSITATDDDELIFRLATERRTRFERRHQLPDTNDNASFTVTASGELKLVAKLDYEQADTDLVSSTTNDAATTDRVEYTVIVTAD